MDKCYGIIYQQYECNNPSCESVKEKHAKTPAKLAQLTAMDASGDLKKICMSEENPTKLRGLGVSFASIDPRLIGDDGLLPDELRVRYHVKLYSGQPGGWDAELETLIFRSHADISQIEAALLKPRQAHEFELMQRYGEFVESEKRIEESAVVVDESQRKP